LVTVAEAVAPRRFERVNRRYVNGLQFAAEPAPATDGNLYAPVSDDRAEARGGWRRCPGPAASAPPVGRGRTAGRRLNHHRSDCHPPRSDLTGEQPRLPDEGPEAAKRSVRVTTSTPRRRLQTQRLRRLRAAGRQRWRRPPRRSTVALNRDACFSAESDKAACREAVGQRRGPSLRPSANRHAG
jgi:hypothetical protein